MANEATITSGLRILKTSGSITQMDYNSHHAFTATVTGTKGPVPGAVTISTSGTVIDLSELTQPGLCKLKNLDDTNFVEVGVWDDPTYLPFCKLLPGEEYPFRLADDLAPSGTAGYSLRGVADTADVILLVEAFET